MLIIVGMEILWKSLIITLLTFMVNYKTINDVLNLRANIGVGMKEKKNKQSGLLFICASTSTHRIDLKKI